MIVFFKHFTKIRFKARDSPNAKKKCEENVKKKRETKSQKKILRT